MTFPLEVQRFPWSGKNRVSERRVAALNLCNILHHELNVADRLVFVIAHSHGGNVVVSAMEGLPTELRRSVRLILMATPFLKPIQRFDVRQIFNLLPAFVQSNLPMICLFSAMIPWALFWLHLKNGASEEQSFSIASQLGWLQLPIVIVLFFFPVFVVDRLWRIVQKLISQLPTDAVVQRYDLTIHTLVLAYSQDEAFMALSVVINLLSLLHQIVFVFIAATAWLSSRSKIIDWLAELPWVIFFGGVLITMWGFAAAIVISFMVKVWPALNDAAEGLLSLGSSVERDYLWPSLEFSMTSFFALVVIIGLIMGLASISMMIIGTARVALFTAIGVIDTVRNQSELFNAAVGGVLVSMIPEGHAESVMIDGRTLFNHTRIYDDPNAQKEILRFMQREGNTTCVLTSCSLR